MKGKSRILVGALTCCLLFSTLILTGCGGSGAETKTDAGYSLVNANKLTVGSDCDYPPFIQLDADGNPEGFEYDLMKAISEEMGIQVNYLSPQAFDTLIPQIVAGGKMDVAVSSFTITPERSQQVDFSDPYFKDGVDQAITTLKDAPIKERDELKGKKVGVQSGTTGETWAKENLTTAQVVPFPNITDAFNAMTAGKVDACVNDLQTATALIEKSFTNVAVMEKVPTAEEYGIVVSKSNPKLTEAINKALAALETNGTYDEIYNKWFGK